MNLPSLSRLKEILSYCPESGEFHWRVSIGGAKVGNRAGAELLTGYRAIRIDKVLYLEHRLAWLYESGLTPNVEIDHANCSRADNRIANLRLATASQQRGNTAKRRRNTSGIKGVSWHSQRSKWRANICVNGRHSHLGLFIKIEDAAEAYAKAAQTHFGEFARL